MWNWNKQLEWMLKNYFHLLGRFISFFSILFFVHVLIVVITFYFFYFNDRAVFSCDTDVQGNFHIRLIWFCWIAVHSVFPLGTFHLGKYKRGNRTQVRAKSGSNKCTEASLKRWCRHNCLFVVRMGSDVYNAEPLEELCIFRSKPSAKVACCLLLSADFSSSLCLLPWISLKFSCL